jgi:hypothetical protein
MHCDVEGLVSFRRGRPQSRGQRSKNKTYIRQTPHRMGVSTQRGGRSKFPWAAGRVEYIFRSCKGCTDTQGRRSLFHYSGTAAPLYFRIPTPNTSDLAARNAHRTDRWDQTAAMTSSASGSMTPHSTGGNIDSIGDILPQHPCPLAGADVLPGVYLCYLMGQGPRWTTKANLRRLDDMLVNGVSTSYHHMARFTRSGHSPVCAVDRKGRRKDRKPLDSSGISKLWRAGADTSTRPYPI